MITFDMKSRIMFGVYLIYSLRKVTNPFVAESLIFVVLGSVLSILVSIPSVLSNMYGSESFYQYFMSAFSSTDLIVKSILILTALTLFLFFRNVTVYTVFKQRLA